MIWCFGLKKRKDKWSIQLFLFRKEHKYSLIYRKWLHSQDFPEKNFVLQLFLPIVYPLSPTLWTNAEKDLKQRMKMCELYTTFTERIVIWKHPLILFPNLFRQCLWNIIVLSRSTSFPSLPNQMPFPRVNSPNLRSRSLVSWSAMESRFTSFPQMMRPWLRSTPPWT